MKNRKGMTTLRKLSTRQIEELLERVWNPDEKANSIKARRFRISLKLIEERNRRIAKLSKKIRRLLP